MDEAKIFSVQSDLIVKAAELFQTRINSLETLARDLSPNNDPADNEKNVAIYTFAIRSLNLFRDTLTFISTEIIRQELERAYFLLAQTRTLLDVYSRFIHLYASRTNDNRALKCIAYQLFTSAGLGDDSMYKKVLLCYKNFLTKIKFNFPPECNEFDFVWYRDNDLRFPSNNKTLTSDNIKRCSAYTMDVFKSEKTSTVYSHLSELMHGNPYYYGAPHNERFWIVGVSIPESSFLIELIDRYLLDKINPRDFRLWLSEIKKTRADFVQLWKQRTPYQTK